MVLLPPCFIVGVRWQTYKSGAEFLRLFNPSYQGDYCRDLYRVYFGKAPQLRVLGNAFGENVVKTWLSIQLRDFSEFCGNKDKLRAQQISQLADVIALNFGYLSATEFMHFLQQFKAGRFGRFYGSVDALTITCALRDFEAIRSEEKARLTQEAERREEEEAERQHDEEVRRFRELLKRYGITANEYLLLKDVLDGQHTDAEIAEATKRIRQRHKR